MQIKHQQNCKKRILLKNETRWKRNEKFSSSWWWWDKDNESFIFFFVFEEWGKGKRDTWMVTKWCRENWIVSKREERRKLNKSNKKGEESFHLYPYYFSVDVGIKKNEPKTWRKKTEKLKGKLCVSLLSCEKVYFLSFPPSLQILLSWNKEKKSSFYFLDDVWQETFTQSYLHSRKIYSHFLSLLFFLSAFLFTWFFLVFCVRYSHPLWQT